MGGTSIYSFVFGLPRLRLHVSGFSPRIQRTACTCDKGFSSRTKDNQSQRVASQCSTERVSPTEGPLYKRDEHYRSVSSQWEIMHPLEETPLHLSYSERKYKRRAENKLFRVFPPFSLSLSPPPPIFSFSPSPPPLFGNTSSHGARQLFQRLLAVSQTHPFVSQPFTWFLGSFNPLRSFGISLPFLSLGVPLPPFSTTDWYLNREAGTDFHGFILVKLKSRTIWDFHCSYYRKCGVLELAYGAYNL